MRCSRSLVLVLVLVAEVRAQPVPRDQPAVPCANAPALVYGAGAPGRALTCDGVNDAYRFLAPLGLDRPTVVPIHAVETLPREARPDASGCYLPSTRTVYVLTLPRYQARGLWFGVPASPALYRGLVAHEVAHAIVGCHLGARRLPTAAHEYVAYVTMFATLDARVRNQVLSAMPFDELRHSAEINDFRYAFDPLRFGVEAYRHWRRQPDRMEFLGEVIRGRIAPEFSTF